MPSSLVQAGPTTGHVPRDPEPVEFSVARTPNLRCRASRLVSDTAAAQLDGVDVRVGTASVSNTQPRRRSDAHLSTARPGRLPSGRHASGRARRADSRIQRGRPAPAHRHVGSAFPDPHKRRYARRPRTADRLRERPRGHRLTTEGRAFWTTGHRPAATISRGGRRPLIGTMRWITSMGERRARRVPLLVSDRQRGLGAE